MSPRISSPARGDNNSQGGNRSRGGFKGGRQGRGQRDVGLIGAWSLIILCKFKITISSGIWKVLVETNSELYFIIFFQV